MTHAYKIEQDKVLNSFETRWRAVKQDLKMRGVTMTELEIEVLELITESVHGPGYMSNYLFDEENPQSIKRVKNHLNNLKKKLPGLIVEKDGIYKIKN